MAFLVLVVNLVVRKKSCGNSSSWQSLLLVLNIVLNNVILSLFISKQITYAKLQVPQPTTKLQKPHTIFTIVC